MTTRKKKPNAEEGEEAVSLNALLQEDSDSGGIAYCDIDSNSCLRLIHCATAIGGFITFWVDSTNQRLCFSMRVGSDKRSYQVEDPEAFLQSAESVVSKLSPALLRGKKKPPPALLSIVKSTTKT